MTYKDMLAAGRKMAEDEKELGDNLRSLAADPRFAAVIGLLDQHRHLFSVDGSGQKMAPHHGSLAHCGGSVFALDQILNRLATLYTPRARGGQQAPPPEE